MKHARWLISLCILVVLAFSAFAVRAVFTVRDVTCEFLVEGSDEVDSASKIASAREGKFLPLVSVEELRGELEKNTKFEVVKIEKKYPSGIFVELRERKECFAVKSGTEFWILDENYTVIERRAELKNSYDELENVLLDFGNSEFDPSKMRLRSSLDVGNSKLLEAVKQMISVIDSPRDCFTGVRVVEMEKGVNYYAYFTTREGVEIEVRKILSRGKDKFAVGMEKYLSLPDADKLGAKIAVYELDSGEIVAIPTTEEIGLSYEG